MQHFFLLLSFLISTSFGALYAQKLDADKSLCSEKFLESLPTQAGGRVKPLLVQANETIKFITGKSKVQELKALEVFCLASLSGLREVSFPDIPLLIEHIEAKKLLGIDPDAKLIFAKDVIHQQELVRANIMRMKQSTPLKKELNKVWSRMNQYQMMVSAKAWMVPIIADEQALWHSLADTAQGKGELKVWLEKQKELYIQSQGDDYLLELTYVKSHLFDFALLLALLGIFATALVKKLWPALIFTSLVMVFETIAMIMRVMISGRAPITNMYETVMFSGYGALVIALITLYFKRDKIFLLAGLSYNILCLFMMRFANNMLDPGIAPLVPVLRDNFWLSTHVTTIILSYAALALSWMLANIVLIRRRFFTLSNADYRYYEKLVTLSVQVGVVLLAAGIILGGIWADYSWGRFWGWDPKETWSLIVLLFYMAMMHGKYTKWINTHRFMVLSAAGFMSVMMAWFGVNYILATGLHSYGFSEGGAIFLGAFFGIQTLLLLITGFVPKEKRVV